MINPLSEPDHADDESGDDDDDENDDNDDDDVFGGELKSISNSLLTPTKVLNVSDFNTSLSGRTGSHCKVYSSSKKYLQCLFHSVIALFVTVIIIRPRFLMSGESSSEG